MIMNILQLKLMKKPFTGMKLIWQAMVQDFSLIESFWTIKKPFKMSIKWQMGQDFAGH